MDFLNTKEFINTSRNNTQNDKSRNNTQNSIVNYKINKLLINKTLNLEYKMYEYKKMLPVGPTTTCLR